MMYKIKILICLIYLSKLSYFQLGQLSYDIYNIFSFFFLYAGNLCHLKDKAKYVTCIVLKFCLPEESFHWF